MLPSASRWVPSSLQGAQAKEPPASRSPVGLTRASGNAAQSVAAWRASAPAPCSGSGVSGSSYWKPSAHRGSNRAGSRPDHARSHSSNSSSTCIMGSMTVLRHRDFRNLFLGQSLSTFGDRIVFVALALYVTEIGTPSDVGLVLAAHALPLVGFILLGGVLADRVSRARVMIASDLARFVLHALLATLIFAGAVE